jgi:predicted AlkP superfamily pyrophosphatase or phosphodiesterase
VLVSIDGLPASMLGDGTLPTLDALASEGARAEWLTPSYPTLTFPNHYTLVTGLRPDRHGIVHNNMRDAGLGLFLSKQDGAKDGRWWGGEPIWVTLQRQGGIAATMFWPGSEAEIAGQRPRHYVPFDRTLAPDARVDRVLGWLDLPANARPRLLTLYFEQYDVAAHEHGTSTPQSLGALRRIDRALARLRAGLRARGLDGSTDLIVLSDHGMADVPRTHLRLLDDRLDDRFDDRLDNRPDASTYDVIWWGSFTGIQPKPGHEAEVERAFVGRHDVYACWRKGELPAQWRYGTHPRIPAIVCQSDTGWRVQARRHTAWPNPVKGEHGFAPEAPEMRAVFVAAGPSFKPGVALPAFDNVDVYPLLAHLLGIDPAPNDGRLESTRPALR